MVQTDPNCIFCRIVAGTIPCHKVYEDDHVLAFLDIGPLSRGHTLVIPKGHWATLEQVSDEAGAAIGRVLPRLARAVLNATGAKEWNLLQNNGRAAHQVVDHVHFHIIPKIGDTGLGLDWPAGKLAGENAKALLNAMRQQL
ncbi:MAG: HIT family protein [Phycisphaeraceae bacterium]|nr:HIT family protein [Phycisphaeraceae bacterium]